MALEHMPKLISLFTGAGGLDLGMEAAGFETAVALELDGVAVETLRANREWPVIESDVHEVTSGEILRQGSLAVREADLLIGGPPCQPFSKSGYWASGDTERLDDPRAGTLTAFLRILNDTLPRAFLIENVPGLAYKQKSEGLDLVDRKIDQINREQGTKYSFSVAKLNAAEFGVPQMRERVFVIGSRDGTTFAFPEPTHGDIAGTDLDLPGLEPYRTAWDAIGDLEGTDDPELEPRGKWADLLPTIPEGENYLFHTERGGGHPLFGWRRRYWSFLLKLSKQRPSWTLQAQPGPAIGPFHWRSRRLSPHELCRLQTIPEDYWIAGSLADVQRQLGNAVPSALAEVLGRAIRRQLLGQDVELQPTLIPKRRDDVPPPEPTKPLPEKYAHLIGEHEAHPGTGQGYAARRRSKRRQRDKRPEEARRQIPLFG